MYPASTSSSSSRGSHWLVNGTDRLDDQARTRTCAVHGGVDGARAPRVEEHDRVAGGGGDDVGEAPGERVHALLALVHGHHDAAPGCGTGRCHGASEFVRKNGEDDSEAMEQNGGEWLCFIKQNKPKRAAPPPGALGLGAAPPVSCFTAMLLCVSRNAPMVSRVILGSASVKNASSVDNGRLALCHLSCSVRKQTEGKVSQFDQNRITLPVPTDGGATSGRHKLTLRAFAVATPLFFGSTSSEILIEHGR